MQLGLNMALPRPGGVRAPNVAPVVGSQTLTGTVVPGSAPQFDVAASTDGAAAILPNQNIIVPFDRAIKAGTGSFTLWNATLGSSIEVFDMVTELGTSPGQAEVSGQNVVLRPTSQLPVSTNVAVRWTANAVQTLGNIAVAANSTNTLFDFTTAASPIPPVFVGRTFRVGTGATQTLSLTGLVDGIDTQPRDGDFVIGITGVANAADIDVGLTAAAVTAGWTELDEGYANDSNDANAAVFYKRMTSTPDTSVEVIGSGAGTQGGVTMVEVWRGISAATPFDVTYSAASHKAQTLNTNRWDAPAITPVNTYAVVIGMGLGASGATTTTHTAPSGVSRFFAALGTGSSRSAQAGMWSLEGWTSGAVDIGPVGGVDNISDSFVAFTVALRPG